MYNALWCNKKPSIAKNKSTPLWACLLFWLCCAVPTAQAQNSPYTSGTEFMTVDYNPWSYNEQLGIEDSLFFTTIHLAGVNSSCVNISIAGLGYSQTVFVPKDSVVSVKLPLIIRRMPDSVYNNGIEIISSAPVAVYQSANQFINGISVNYYGEATVVLPKTTNKTEQLHFSDLSYIVSNGNRYYQNTINLVQFLALEDLSFDFLTRVNLSTNLNDLNEINVKKDSTLSISLKKGEVIQYITNWTPNTLINESEIFIQDSTALKILLFGRSMSKEVQKNGYRINAQNYESIKPVHPQATSFHSPPWEGYQAIQYSLLASEDSTVVSYNGVPGTVLQKKERVDTSLTGTMHITANKPLLCYISPFPLDTLYNDELLPSQISVTMSADNELIKESLFATLRKSDSINHFMLSVVTPTAATGQFLLDGVAVGSAAFSPFPADPAWSWANIEIAPGTHKAQSATGFHAFHYTWYYDFSNPVYPISPVIPSYAYNLAESIVWPADSFAFKAGNSPQQLLPFAQAQPEICAGEALFFQASNQRHTTWHWQFGDGTDTIIKVENEKPKPFAHTFAQPGQYWVTVQDSAGCAPGDSLLVEVLPNPTAAFSATSTASCTGTFVQLQNQSTGAQEYFWQWPNGSSTAQNPNFQYVGNETEIEITLIAKSENCSDTATQTFNIELLTFNPRSVPNIITPNNDGRNDAFCIPNVAGFAECFDLQIFNRWGQAVFSTQNPQDCWRGQFQNRPAADGVYFYVLQLAGQTYQGEVTVMGGE